MNEEHDILIEKFLAGELDDDELKTVDDLLDRDPAFRDRLETSQQDDVLLGLEIQANLERVDWSRIRRVRSGIQVYHWFFFVFWLAVGGLLAKVLIEDGLTWQSGLGIFPALYVLARISDAWIDAYRSRRLFTWLERREGDFLDSYRLVLEKEWKEHRQSFGGLGCFLFVLFVLSFFGNFAEECALVGAAFTVHHLITYFLVVRPLRREREELAR